MSRKQRGTREGEERKADEYYRLNIRAVDDLVTANSENSPKVSREELRRYQSRRLHLSDWLKAVLIKIWFAGAVCFFFLWGLGNYISDQLDRLVVLGLALGFVTDLLTNNLLRFIAGAEGAYDRFMMFPKKRYLTLPLNILYAFVLLFFVVFTYQGINLLLKQLFDTGDSVPLGVGPILFGVFTTGWDLIFLLMKRTVRRMIEDAKQR